MNNTNNNPNKQSFVDSFNSISNNLTIRYSINMHLDFINEFIKYADNTRDTNLLTAICGLVCDAEHLILKEIKNFENERDNKENLD